MSELPDIVNRPAILIVENNQENSRVLTGLLNKNYNNFYYLAIVDNKKSAIDFFSKNSKAIHLIIASTTLPGLDCFTAINEIKKVEGWQDEKRPAHVPIIIVCDDFKNHLEKLKDVSYDAGFEYPLLESKFLKEVERCLQRK